VKPQRQVQVAARAVPLWHCHRRTGKPSPPGPRGRAEPYLFLLGDVARFARGGRSPACAARVSQAASAPTPASREADGWGPAEAKGFDREWTPWRKGRKAMEQIWLRGNRVSVLGRGTQGARVMELRFSVDQGSVGFRPRMWRCFHCTW
jgi:hypothetical protein